MRFWPEVTPVFISRNMESCLLSFFSNWFKMYKMKCMRQINKHYIPLFALFYRIYTVGMFGVCLTEKIHNVDGHERWNYTTLNIHIFLKECIREFKLGMMTYYHLFNSCGGFVWRKKFTMLMDMNVEIIQLWTFIYSLRNALGSSNWVWWHIIIFLIHVGGLFDGKNSQCWWTWTLKLYNFELSYIP